MRQNRGLGILMVVWGLVSCGAPNRDNDYYQGYVEAEWVRVAVPVSGVLTQLQVVRGGLVERGTPLFQLEQGRELAVRDEALSRLQRAQAQADNLAKGKRPLEIQILLAQRQQVAETLQLSTLTFQREQRLSVDKLIAAHELDIAQHTLARDQARLQELDSQLALAKLGARDDEWAAAQADIKVYQALLAQAEWALAQRTVVAPVAGQVFDTLYAQGEWVNAGSPVVSLLPPTQIKIRFFVAEGELGVWQVGQTVRVGCDGCATEISAVVAYLAPNAEYTPPVLYNRDNRNKLLYLLEARPNAGDAVKLHPGQPLTVRR